MGYQYLPQSCSKAPAAPARSLPAAATTLQCVVEKTPARGWASSSIAVTCFIIRTFQVPPRTRTEPAKCLPNGRERPGGVIYPANAAIRTEMKVPRCFSGIPVSEAAGHLERGGTGGRSEEHTSELQSL